MKDTGMVRKIDDLGRVVIPMEIRNELNINNKDRLEIYIEGDTIVLRKRVTGCIFCQNSENLFEVKNNKFVCVDCLNSMER